MRQLIIRNLSAKKEGIINGDITAFLFYLNPQPPAGYFHCGASENKEMFTDGNGSYFFVKKLYNPGDIIYLREEFVERTDDQGQTYYLYRADGNAPDVTKWNKSTKMPYDAARIFLEVIKTQIIRFDDLTPDAAKALGATGEEPVQQAREDWDNEVYRRREYMKSDRDPWLQLAFFRTSTREAAEAVKKPPKRIVKRTYTIRRADTGEIVAAGAAAECAKTLGCSTLDEFYDLAARILSGREPQYTLKRITPD